MNINEENLGLSPCIPYFPFVKEINDSIGNQAFCLDKYLNLQKVVTTLQPQLNLPNNAFTHKVTYYTVVM